MVLQNRFWQYVILQTRVIVIDFEMPEPVIQDPGSLMVSRLKS
jgi:hypothetical protein